VKTQPAVSLSLRRFNGAFQSRVTDGAGIIEVIVATMSIVSVRKCNVSRLLKFADIPSVSTAFFEALGGLEA